MRQLADASSTDRRTTAAELRDELANTVRMQLSPTRLVFVGGVD
jgi:hypothetical protein